jgi:7-cyano-7-deazaguanine reductase
MVFLSTPEQSTLGKTAPYECHYNPTLLFPIPRKTRRDEIGMPGSLPFFGYDLWNHYEVSWLNSKGKPTVAVAKIIYGCDSINIIESKSMKLYFNSLNNTCFTDLDAVRTTVENDLRERLEGSFLTVMLTPLEHFREETLHARLSGFYLDALDVECTEYHTNPALLTTGSRVVEETVCSDLLKSNCLVTNQPDWCSVQIHYKGKQINHEGLLRYLVSFRNDNEFHEQCIEKIFMHLQKHCDPSELTLYGRSTRRGGLDINSCRSTKPMDPLSIANTRLCRQ